MCKMSVLDKQQCSTEGGTKLLGSCAEVFVQLDWPHLAVSCRSRPERKPYPWRASADPHRHRSRPRMGVSCCDGRV